MDKDIAVIDNIESKIMENQILFVPNFSLPFSLTCDASNNAMVGILTQNKSLVRLFNRKLSDKEK